MYRRTSLGVHLSLACLLTTIGTAFGAMDEKTIAEGLKSHDRALHITDRWIRDPYIVLGPDGYCYLTGTTFHPDPKEPNEAKESRGGGTVRVWRSRDLISWEYLGVVFTLKDGIWFKQQPDQFAKVKEDQWAIWAPELYFVNGRWALIHTSPGPLHSANLALTQGPELKGPWDNPMGVRLTGPRHDPSLFRDDDGTWTLIWNGFPDIQPLKPDFTDFAAKALRIGPSGEQRSMGHEGCLMRKIGGKYVIFGTGWSTGKMRKGSYNLYYAVADKITGPYGPRLFVGRFLGHGTLFQDKAGQWWCTAFFNADRPTLTREQARGKDLSETALTINPQGVTIVPLEVNVRDNGSILIRAKDPDYATPGPDEAQKF